MDIRLLLYSDPPRSGARCRAARGLVGGLDHIAAKGKVLRAWRCSPGNFSSSRGVSEVSGAGGTEAPRCLLMCSGST